MFSIANQNLDPGAVKLGFMRFKGGIMSQKHIALLAFVFVGLVACNTGEVVKPPPIVTPVAPKLLSSSPNDAAVSVDKQNFVLQVVFDKAMDTTATQAAFQSSDLKTTGASFAWSGDKKTLSITPSAALEYATVAASTEAAKVYTYGFTNAAKDGEGAALAAVTRTFKTKRNLSKTLEIDDAVSGTVVYWDNKCLTPTHPVKTAENYHATEIQVGDTKHISLTGKELTPGNQYKGFAGFNLAGLPAGTTWDSAKLVLVQAHVFNKPFANLGTLQVQHIGFQAGGDFGIDSAKFAAYTDAALSTVGTISGADLLVPKTYEYNVLSQFNEGLTIAARGKRAVFRLVFETSTNDANVDPCSLAIIHEDAAKFYEPDTSKVEESKFSQKPKLVLGAIIP
jgi:Bacterial Ig-like domain